MSEIKKYLFGTIGIEYQTEADRRQALAIIIERRRIYERSSDFHHLRELRPALAKMAQGDYCHDELVVSQSELNCRIVGLFSWRRQNLPSFDSPKEFGGSFLYNSYSNNKN